MNGRQVRRLSRLDPLAYTVHNLSLEATMKKTSAEVDAYIAKSAPFAQPILKRLRRLMHQACPDIEETIKWGFPHFDYKGIVASMAAFKQHMAFGFWKRKLMKDPHAI